MIEALHALVGAVEAGRRVPELIQFIRTYPGISVSFAVVLIAGVVAAIFIHRRPAEKSLSIR